MILKMNFILFLNVRLTNISDLNISNHTIELDHPAVFKLVQLLSTENVKELCNLGKFLINAYKLRENLNSV